MKVTLRLGHSADADDAFMFYALTEGKINTDPIRYEHFLYDIETLNKIVLQDGLDISAVSVHVCAYLTRRYCILASGASIGKGYGPIVVAKREANFNDLRRSPIAVPGSLTTAFLALRLCIGLFPFVIMPFDRIMEAVIKDEVPFGLLIHEGQLTYADANLVKVLDLGEWWRAQTNLSLPLGVNVIRKDLPSDIRQLVAKHLRQSVAYAFSHREEVLEYALTFGRGLDSHLTQKFINMYVNELTEDMGETGKQAIVTFLAKAAQNGLVPYCSLDFVV